MSENENNGKIYHLGKLQTLIILYKKNRSFEHYIISSVLLWHWTIQWLIARYNSLSYVFFVSKQKNKMKKYTKLQFIEIFSCY